MHMPAGLVGSLMFVPLLVTQEPIDKLPDPAVAALDKALARAAERHTRVAVLVDHPTQPGGEVEAMQRWWRRARLGDVPLRYEYEFVHYTGSVGLLMQRLQTPIIEPVWPMVLCAADGQVLAQRAVVPATDDDKALASRMAWLDEHRVVMPEAGRHLAEALALASKSDRRVLVHLGAPW